MFGWGGKKKLKRNESKRLKVNFLVSKKGIESKCRWEMVPGSDIMLKRNGSVK